MSQQDLATVSGSHGDQNRDRTPPMCPACGSMLTRRSMRRSWQDRFKSFFGQWPYRCQMCSMRFTGPQDAESIARHNAATEEELRVREEETRTEEDRDEESPDNPPDRQDKKQS